MTFALSPSDFIVNVSIIEGGVLCPGGSCPSTQNLVGFMQLFIKDISASGTINAYILSITKCPSGPSGGGGAGQGFDFIPVRLVQYK